MMAAIDLSAWLPSSVAWTALLVLHVATASAQVCTQHEYLGNGPDEGNPGWHEEANGLAHDADHWYATQNTEFFAHPGPPPRIAGGPRLWRIPVTTNLASGVDCGVGGVSCRTVADTPPLFTAGYGHYGDHDVFEFGGQGYVVVPIEGGEPGNGVAFFRADATLELVGFAPVPGQTSWGWVAIGHDGTLVSSEFEDVTALRRYAVDWAHLHATGEVAIAPLDFVVLEDEAGGALELQHMQGGEFADDDGQLLYLANGFLGDQHPTWGVHVFRTRSGSGDECRGLGDSCTVARRIERSHENPGGFTFEFDPSDGLNDPQEEPEGLTFWDLDSDGRAPGLRGQLHVILLDNDDANDDDVYVKHYRRSFGDDAPPEVTCPSDASAECSSHGGTPADDPQLSPFFAGASVSDNCDESIVTTNDAPALFGLGTTDVEFSAEDDFGNSSQCVAAVTVADTMPPSVDCPEPGTVECTSAQGISSGDSQLAPFFQGAAATDVCDAAPAVSNDAPAVLPFGDTTVTFTATDASSNPSSCTSTVTVADTGAPAISVRLSRTTLWPPNHKLVPITASVTVVDPCDPSASFELVSIASIEPDDATGDGSAAPDVQGASFGTADTSFALRAERSGNGSGRVYTIVYRAVDASGNSADASASVTVPSKQ